MAQSFFSERYSTFFKCRTMFFSKGSNNKIAKIHLQNSIKNHWANLRQTWHKTSWSEGNSSVLKKSSRPFLRKDYDKIGKVYWKKKPFLFQYHWAIFNQIDKRANKKIAIHLRCCPWASCLKSLSQLNRF